MLTIICYSTRLGAINNNESEKKEEKLPTKWVTIHQAANNSYMLLYPDAVYENHMGYKIMTLFDLNQSCKHILTNLYTSIHTSIDKDFRPPWFEDRKQNEKCEIWWTKREWKKK